MTKSDAEAHRPSLGRVDGAISEASPVAGLALVLVALMLLTPFQARAGDDDVTAFGRIGPVVVHGNERDLLTLGAGAFALFDGKDRSAVATLEYRFGRKVFFVGPAMGLLANTDGGVFGYVAIYTDFSIGRFHVTPEVAFGGYREGDSRDLGGIFQFRASGDLTYRFAGGTRLGLRFGHISNAGTQSSNGGEEDLLLIYSIPLGPYL